MGNNKKLSGFAYEWDGVYKFRTFTEWGEVTGIPRATVSSRYHNDRTLRQCIGLDPIKGSTVRRAKEKLIYDIPNSRVMRKRFLYGY